MAGYPGRYDFGISKRNFGGINEKSSLLTVPDNGAQDILNFDLFEGGHIQRRGGTQFVYNFGSPIAYFTKYLYQGTEIFFAVTTNGKFWSATALAGPWTDVTGSLVWTDFGTTNPIIGAVLASKLVLCNGVDKPAVYVYGSNMETLEDASLEDVATTSGTFSHTGGGGGSNADYYLVGVTPRGDTPLYSFTRDTGAPLQTALTAAITNDFAWVNNGEFTAFKLIMKPRTSGISRAGHTGTLSDVVYYTVATLGAAIESFSDTGGPVTAYTPVNTSAAYNTPSDWNTNGQPFGMAYVGKNRDERLFAWRKNAIWACSLSEPTNWFREDDAFAFTVIGADDTYVKGIAGLFDYTMIMSVHSCFLYQGASPTTIRLDKVIPVGCASHNSITYAGTDAYWWSQYGPTSGSRILSGADVAVNTSTTDKIGTLVRENTNLSRWPFICAVTDIANNRIYWGVSKAAATTNNQTVTYNYEVDGYVRYDGFTWVGGCVYNQDVYIGSTDGKIYKMNTGDVDGETAITASYTTGWQDMGSYSMNKRMLWVDVIADRRPGNYSFSFNYGVDFGQVTGTAQTATQTTTDGQTIETTSSTAAEHRFYTDAIGNCFQLVFSTSSSTPLRLVAWRPEIRARGVRQ